jgi:hypothetical protein
MTKFLPIYLNDHLAGATGGVELVRRAESSNRGNTYGDFLAGLRVQVEEDRETLRRVMEALDVGADHTKVVAAWMAEKMGRFKLNGQLTGYSPLSRLVELEALRLGVEGKLGMWRSLAELAASEPRLASFDFGALIERAEAQRADLEEHRLRAAADALGG